MSFWQRVRTTMHADAHGVIDALEDRALLLKQHLREAESEVQHKRARLQALEREQTRLHKERERIARERARYDRDAELALQENQDALARHALERLLPLEQLDARIGERLVSAGEEHTALAAAVAEQQHALDELQAKVTSFLAERAQRDGGCDSPYVPRPVEAQTVELELLRRKRAQRDAHQHASTQERNDDR